ncbi:MAG: ATP synthase F0 subunit B [Acidimicrobiales bacterium]|nr:ATP synthase F0 subunit B [Acidimicrobiales bacterium]
MTSWDDHDDGEPPAYTTPPVTGAGPGPETLMKRVMDVINNTRPMPLSSSHLLNNKDEVIELLQDAVDRLPDELRQARWLLKEREEFLARTQREADEIIDVARTQASRMVQKTEIVREAQLFAQRTIDNATDEANRLRNEAEDYCDQKLAQFEIVLQRTLKTVHQGREKLQVTPLPEAQEGDIDYTGETGDVTVFDQDEF